jgi:putative transposase
LINPQDENFSIAVQCDLLGLARSSYYYEPAEDSQLNLTLMRLIDEEYTRHPFYGSRRMTQWLNYDCGYNVNRKRVIKLMHRMGLEAIYPKQTLSISQEGHEKMPYLLRGLKIMRPNQVWSSDITYIRMWNGFLYLTVVLDWYSRYVIAWRLSNTLDASFCVEALREAFTINKPEISNTDQGSQYTCGAYISCLKENGIKISMDGRGRALDNIFNERLWRSVKYEEVYLRDYRTVNEAEDGLRKYFAFYNNERRHQSLNYLRPVDVYFSEIMLPELCLEVK